MKGDRDDKSAKMCNNPSAVVVNNHMYLLPPYILFFHASMTQRDGDIYII